MKRAVGLALVLVALLAEPALANGVHAGTGPSSLLLAAAAVLLVGGIWSIIRKRAGPLGWLAVAVGAAVGVLAFVLPGGQQAAPQVDVTIVRPVVGSDVPAGEPVTVKVRLFGAQIATSPTDTDGGHLHLYVDGELQQMPYSTTAEVELGPGSHTLRVEYVDNQHRSFDPEIDATIDVVAG